MHSLTNLFPILKHFGIDLKYICTKESIIGENNRIGFMDSSFITDLRIILNDPDIEAVFVSANPEAHAQILTSLLLAGKKVFIEKPPCSNSKELSEIINIKKQPLVKVGFQRRYWPGNKHLIKIRNSARSYSYQFYFGPYPQGNVINELFIHAIDYCIFLFGDFSILSSTHQKYDGGISTQMHVKHTNGITGLIELSTHYTWTDPLDLLSIHCLNELLEVNYPTLIEGKLKPKRILNLPTERIIGKPLITKRYFAINNLVLPSFELNTLVLQGFYDEVRTFIRLVEDGHHSENDLPGLVSLYKILDELNETAYKTALS